MKNLAYLLFCVTSCIFALEGDLTPIGPYISTDAFRSICNFRLEDMKDEFWSRPTPNRYRQMQEIDIVENIKVGDIVFVQANLISYFLKNIHPKISVPYFILAHRTDTPLDDEFIEYMNNDSKIVKWFAQNVNIEHEKVIPIPIGIPARFWYLARTRNLQLIEKLQKRNYKRSPKVYLNITLGTNLLERQRVLNYFTSKPFIKNCKHKRYHQYLIDLKRSRFCLSPSGNGIDCWRTWEALLMGSIPIICPYEKYSNRKVVGDDFLFEDLPVIRVKDWTEVTQEFLDKKYAEMQHQTFNYDKLYFPFWKKLILDEVEAFKEEYANYSSPQEYFAAKIDA